MRPRHTEVLLVLALLASAATSLVAAGPAAAHNVLRSTSPAASSSVPLAPDQVVLTFDQPAVAVGTTVQVVGPDGPVSAGDPELVDETVTQPLAPGSPAGDYTVTWRVTSADGHPIEGTFAFTAEAGATTTSTTSGMPTPSPELAGEEDARGSAGGGLLWLGLVALLLVGAGVLVQVRRRAAAGGPPD